MLIETKGVNEEGEGEFVFDFSEDEKEIFLEAGIKLILYTQTLGITPEDVFQELDKRLEERLKQKEL